jgi:hypothetical protein
MILSAKEPRSSSTPASGSIHVKHLAKLNDKRNLLINPMPAKLFDYVSPKQGNVYSFAEAGTVKQYADPTVQDVFVQPDDLVEQNGY